MTRTGFLTLIVSRQLLDLCQWKRKVPIKRLDSKDTRQNFQVQLPMGAFLKMESSEPLEKPEKANSGADVGPRSASEKLGRIFGWKRRDSESSTGLRHES